MSGEPLLKRNRTRHARRRRHAAWTLVELLVTLAIIGLLLAILLPSLSRARSRARVLQCQAQLRQIGAALQLYVNHNRGRYPASPALPSVNPSALAPVTTLLAPYLSTAEVFECPDDQSLFPAEGTSYFYYQELGERPLGDTHLYQVFRSPSLVPALWDADAYHGGALPLNWLFVDGHVGQRAQ